MVGNEADGYGAGRTQRFGKCEVDAMFIVGTELVALTRSFGADFAFRFATSWAGEATSGASHQSYLTVSLADRLCRFSFLSLTV